jgi:hypothetical protein
MGPHSCKDCLRGCMMAGSSKDGLKVPPASCKENGFGDIDSMPCRFSHSSDCKRYIHAFATTSYGTITA